MLCVLKIYLFAYIRRRNLENAKLLAQLLYGIMQHYKSTCPKNVERYNMNSTPATTTGYLHLRVFKNAQWGLL